MGGLFRNLLNKISSVGKPAPLEIAIFGKHPGASDHFEYIPAEDEILNEIWALLYRRSMEELIAGWNELGDNALPDFNHIWLWSRGTDWVAGRMWSSVDSTGRAHFPLVVCIHGTGPLTPFFLQSIMPALESLETQCKQTASIQDVREHVDQIRTELREKSLVQLPMATSPSWLRDLFELPEYKNQPERIHHLLLPFSHDLIEKNAEDSKILGDIPASYSLRMPRCVATAEESLLVWHELLVRLTGQATQMIMIAPLEHSWVDLLVGGISPAGLFCIKAPLEKRRISTEGEQQFSPAFVQSADRFVASVLETGKKPH